MLKIAEKMPICCDQTLAPAKTRTQTSNLTSCTIKSSALFDRMDVATTVGPTRATTTCSGSTVFFANSVTGFRAEGVLARVRNAFRVDVVEA